MSKPTERDIEVVQEWFANKEVRTGSDLYCDVAAYREEIEARLAPAPAPAREDEALCKLENASKALHYQLSADGDWRKNQDMTAARLVDEALTALRSRQSPQATDGDGSAERPFTATYNAKCFKRHDSDLTLGICERDNAFEINVIPQRSGPTRHYRINADGSWTDLAAPQPSLPVDYDRLMADIRSTHIGELLDEIAAETAQPSPQEEDAEALLDALDQYARDYDSYEYGLPSRVDLSDEYKAPRADMLAIIAKHDDAMRARLASAQSSAQGEEAFPILDRLRHLTPGGSEFQTANECFAWLEKRLTRKPWKDDSAREMREALQAMFDAYEGVYDMAHPTNYQSAEAKHAEELARAALERKEGGAK